MKKVFIGVIRLRSLIRLANVWCLGNGADGAYSLEVSLGLKSPWGDIYKSPALSTTAGLRSR